MKTCTICGHEIKDGEIYHKYWIPEYGEWCCNACMKHSEEAVKELDVVIFQSLIDAADKKAE